MSLPAGMMALLVVVQVPIDSGRVMYRGQCYARCPDPTGIECDPCRSWSSRDGLARRLWRSAEQRDQAWAQALARAARDPAYQSSLEFRQQRETYERLLQIDSVASSISGDRTLSRRDIDQMLATLHNSTRANRNEQ